MKEVKHAYSNICKEEKFNNMLSNGYKLSRIEGRRVYFFEKCERQQYVCKVLLVDESNYDYIEKVCNYTKIKGLIKVDALDKNHNVIRLYIFAEDEAELRGLPNNYDYVVKEYKKAVKEKMCTVVFAMMFAAIFISQCKWIAIAEVILAVLCIIEVGRRQKKIKMLKLQMQGDQYE